MRARMIGDYVAFVVAAGSVAAGRARDAWIMALAGWFLINGHVCFLLFVPVITCAVLAAVLWPRRHRLGAEGRKLAGPPPPAAVRDDPLRPGCRRGGCGREWVGR